MPWLLYVSSGSIETLLLHQTKTKLNSLHTQRNTNITDIHLLTAFLLQRYCCFAYSLHFKNIFPFSLAKELSAVIFSSHFIKGTSFIHWYFWIIHSAFNYFRSAFWNEILILHAMPSECHNPGQKSLLDIHCMVMCGMPTLTYMVVSLSWAR